MQVTVRVLVLPAESELEAGLNVTVPPGIVISDLIRTLAERFPLFADSATKKKTGVLLPQVVVILNGVHADVSGGLAAPLKHQDEVVFFPALSGG
ncbi:MAG: MoaD/ThiS family protein [Bacillota bacterium]